MCDTCGCNVTDGNRHLLRDESRLAHTADGHRSIEVLQGLLHLGDRCLHHVESGGSIDRSRAGSEEGEQQGDWVLDSDAQSEITIRGSEIYVRYEGRFRLARFLSRSFWSDVPLAVTVSMYARMTAYRALRKTKGL